VIDVNGFTTFVDNLTSSFTLLLQRLDDINANLSALNTKATSTNEKLDSIYSRLEHIKVDSFVNVRVMDEFGITAIPATVLTGLLVSGFVAGGPLDVKVVNDALSPGVLKVNVINDAAFPVEVGNGVGFPLHVQLTPSPTHVIVDSGSIVVSGVPHVVVDDGTISARAQVFCNNVVSGSGLPGWESLLGHRVQVVQAYETGGTAPVTVATTTGNRGTLLTLTSGISNVGSNVSAVISNMAENATTNVYKLLTDDGPL